MTTPDTFPPDPGSARDDQRRSLRPTGLRPDATGWPDEPREVADRVEPARSDQADRLVPSGRLDGVVVGRLRGRVSVSQF